MPIESLHPQYEAFIAKWKRCRDAYEGEDAVKDAGPDYLPKISPRQAAQAYNAYRARASYYEAVARTVDGFVGAVARKPHTIKLPSQLEVFMQDATTYGMGLDEFIKKLCAETMLIGRCGILVDFDEALNRSYFTVYEAEAITNWSPTSIVLKETVYEADPDDQYAQKAIDQLRQLQLDGGVYRVTIWRKLQGSQPGAREWAIYEETTPTRRGGTLSAIPFYWLSPAGQTAAIDKPALLGLVNMSMSHYRTSADLEHGRHFTAIPTLYITGSKSDDPIEVGGGAVIEIADAQAKVGYAEFSGEGLGSLENALEAKERQMAVLGAAVFTGQKKGVEAAETARIRTSGENSLLMGVVTSVEDTLQTALQAAAEWMGVAKASITVDLNKEFVDVTLDPQTLLGLVAGYQAGAISLETFLFNLQQAEMTPPDMILSQEVSKLSAAAAQKMAEMASTSAGTQGAAS